MLGEASPSSLDSYSRGLKQLMTVHGPGAWSVICQADEIMRSEEWALLREDLDGQEERPAAFVKRSWEYIITCSAFGAPSLLCHQFWYLRVTALLTGTPKRATTAVLDELDGLEPGSAASSSPYVPLPMERPAPPT